MTSTPPKTSARGDLLAIAAIVALVGAMFLIPVTRDFVFTTFGTVFGTLATFVGAIAAAAEDAFPAVLEFLGVA